MPSPRTPLAIANWKMAMTIAESLAYLNGFLPLVEDALDRVEVVLCTPATAIYPMHLAVEALRQPAWMLSLGAQDCSAETEIARTGQLSAALLAEAGCRWVMLGHWEVRRHMGDGDETVHRKLQRAFEAGLNPLLLVGPGAEEYLPLEEALELRLGRILAGYSAGMVQLMAFVYEPETSIGQAAPAAPKQAALGARLIRGWLGRSYGDRIAENVRILYGGSVMPEHAAELLASPDIDGLGASRQGRDPAAFARIVRLIDQVKACRPENSAQPSDR
jgi:triosephosphate isomerase